MGKCENKLNGLEIKNHKLAKEIQALTNAMPDLEDKFMAEAAKHLKRHPSTKAPAQISMVRAQYHHAVDAAEKKIKDVSKELLGQVARFKEARKSVEELKKRVKVIKTFRGGAYRILDNALLATDLLLSPLSGNQLVHRPVSSL